MEKRDGASSVEDMLGLSLWKIDSLGQVRKDVQGVNAEYLLGTEEEGMILRAATRSIL